MSLPFPAYISVKDKYLIKYNGTCPEHVSQLKLIKPYLTSKFPEIKINIACSQDFMYLFGKQQEAIDVATLEVKDYGCVYEMNTRMHSPHPIEMFLADSLITLPPVFKGVVSSRRGLCAICPEGIPPTKSWTDLDALARYVIKYGYKPLFVGSPIHNTTSINFRPAGIDRLKLLKEVQMVMGVECDLLFEAAAIGLPTILLETGLGTNLYKNMFPYGKATKNLLPNG